jgi:hypothetical protein
MPPDSSGTVHEEDTGCDPFLLVVHKDDTANNRILLAVHEEDTANILFCKSL